MVEMKHCPKCNLDLLVEDFDVDQSKPDGRKTHCKTCRSLEPKQLISDTNAALREFFLRMDAGVLANLSAVESGTTNNIPHKIQFLEEVLARIGGVGTLATLYVANMQAAAPGSAIKQRMLDKLVSAIFLCSDDGKVSKPRELMSDEELNAAAFQHAIRIAQDTIPVDAKETA